MHPLDALVRDAQRRLAGAATSAARRTVEALYRRLAGPPADAEPERLVARLVTTGRLSDEAGLYLVAFLGAVRHGAAAVAAAPPPTPARPHAIARTLLAAVRVRPRRGTRVRTVSSR